MEEHLSTIRCPKCGVEKQVIYSRETTREQVDSFDLFDYRGSGGSQKITQELRWFTCKICKHRWLVPDFLTHDMIDDAITGTGVDEDKLFRNGDTPPAKLKTQTPVVKVDLLDLLDLIPRCIDAVYKDTRDASYFQAKLEVAVTYYWPGQRLPHEQYLPHKREFPIAVYNWQYDDQRGLWNVLCVETDEHTKAGWRVEPELRGAFAMLASGKYPSYRYRAPLLEGALKIAAATVEALAENIGNCRTPFTGELPVVLIIAKSTMPTQLLVDLQKRFSNNPQRLFQIVD